MTFEEFCNPDRIRTEQMADKREAIWTIFLELDGLINKTKFAQDYMQRTHAWFSQKMNRISVHGKRQEFTPEECDAVAAAFRQIADRLNAYATEIEAASATD